MDAAARERVRRANSRVVSRKATAHLVVRYRGLAISSAGGSTQYEHLTQLHLDTSYA